MPLSSTYMPELLMINSGSGTGAGKCLPRVGVLCALLLINLRLARAFPNLHLSSDWEETTSTTDVLFFFFSDVEQLRKQSGGRGGGVF